MRPLNDSVVGIRLQIRTKSHMHINERNINIEIAYRYFGSGVVSSLTDFIDSSDCDVDVEFVVDEFS